MTESEIRHVPVMCDRVVELLVPALRGSAPVLLDATLGLGGHSLALLERVPALTVIGIDRDAGALARSRVTLARFVDRVRMHHIGYDRLGEALSAAGVTGVNGVVFDLGVSSMQLDLDERGFAYSRDAPLDMRMDISQPVTAAVIVASYDVASLAAILRRYGEERFATRIARAIVRQRQLKPITSTRELADLVRESIPAATRRTGGHPAKRTFQALRIEVNDELAQLRRALPAAIDALAVGGRLVVLSYQSLGVRLVKATLRAASRDDIPPDLPLPAAEINPELALLTRGAEQPAPAEIAANPRAASARLRAASRTRLGGT